MIVKRATIGGFDGRRFRAVASTARRDRMGDIVRPGGLDLTGYRRAPVILAHHDPSRPIGRAEQIEQTADALEVVVALAEPGTNKDADEIAELIRQRIVQTLSIGFRPIETRPLEGGGTEFVRAELVEISAVSTPANVDALIAASADAARNARRLRLAKLRVRA